MKINEIFYSIQGEGKWTGLPNVFIRTTGCNLRCSYCDTKYAYNEGKELTINKIINKIEKYQCKNICITGGEPLIQNEISNLLEELFDKKYNVCIETNGSKLIDKIPNNDNLIISLDIKCPSSKMNKKNQFKNLKFLKKKDQLKFVINDKEDYEYAKKIVQEYKPPCIIFFQPVWKTDTKKLAEWIINDNLKVKLGIQLHKIIWNDKRGL